MMHIFILLLLTVLTGAQSILKETSSGRVQGQSIKARGTETNIAEFLGVPYAQPPTGAKRFLPPEPVRPWNGVKQTTKLPLSCYVQIDTLFKRHRGVEMWNPKTNLSEDCLYLNIWTPKADPSANLAVMIWIFGGGFYSGSSALALDLYDGSTLAATQNVVVASINYRIGPLGFLYLKSKEAPGNVGLLDQRLALQWLNKNIRNFGGDENRITIFGESAGAASVSLHLLSRQSHGLFNRAIMQSGSALSPWAVQNQSLAYTRSLQVVQLVGCLPKSADFSNKTIIDNDVLQCLQKVSPKDLTEVQFSINGVRYFDVPTPVTIDGDFLTELPASTIQKGHFKRTDLLMGSNTDEGNYFLIYGLPDIFKIRNPNRLTRQQFAHAVSKIFPYQPKIVRESILYQYERSRLNKGTFREILDDITGDYEFICPVVAFADSYAISREKVYMYKFTHRSSNNPWPPWMGVPHGYEIEFIFGDPLEPRKGYTEEEKILSRRMMEYWANFAKNGDPNSFSNGDEMNNKWPRYSEQNKEYLELKNSEIFPVGRGRRFAECIFWNSYVPKLKGEKSLEIQNEECYTSNGSGVSPRYTVSEILTIALLPALILSKWS